MRADAPYPFPGLNPYFEKEWFQVHPAMLAAALTRLQRQMPADLRVSIEQGMKIAADAAEEDTTFRPDVSVWKVHEDTDTQLASAPPNFSPPVVWEVQSPKARHLVVRETSGRLVTAIELLSPSNKHAAGALAYAQKRLGLMQAGINLVEVDLIRRWGLAIMQFEETESAPFLGQAGQSLPAHAVTVFRAELSQQRELYLISYQKTLPAIRVPLRPHDQDVWLNLQELAEVCHTDCAFDKGTDYTRDPEPPLSTEDAAWLDAHLKSRNLR